MQINRSIKKGLFSLVAWGAIFISTMLFSGCTAATKPLPQPEAQALLQGQDEPQGQAQTKTQDQGLEQIPSDPQASLTQPQLESQSASQSQTQAEAGVRPILPSEPAISQSQNQRLKEIPILYYHSIDREVGNELRIPAEEFEAHLKYLYQSGYRSITLHELYQHFYEERELPNKPFVLTFDDGYADNYLNAFQIAKKYGFTGTIFMVTGWIDGEGYLTKEQLREMSKAGWQIEAHTVSHPKLNELAVEQLENELRESKRHLEELLNRPVNYLAYPFGSYTEEILRESKAAGYIMGLTTERGWAKEKEPYRIQRVYCYADMGVEELKRRMENPNY